ncbi:pyridoxal phosphate-dependent transferase [Dunaliella salina]|uniref:alanine--glyoxylate transaminase n=1 Tax=Dunaliella salina TaxID=3046 RepID=A0ABQ7G019_DUNSA|nr:pyridoxal phosphate-dependent transferase [Dunaliella salina]|eukprot:KAF5827946.1 pyridoxal phosphate-dependent transferase [Dunaliella salina]
MANIQPFLLIIPILALLTQFLKNPNTPALIAKHFPQLCTNPHSAELLQRIKLSKLCTMPEEHKQLMIPGPVEVHEDVLSAAGGLSMSHVDPVFVNQFGEALELLRKVLVTETGQPFIVSASGTLGWDMVAVNLVEPGEDILVLNTGFFGDRFAESLEVYGGRTTHVRAPVGSRPTMAAIQAALNEKPYKMVTITHVDTSTGVLMPVEAISKMVKAKNPKTIVVVDGVCSIGGETLLFDAWNVDVAMTASQKALGAPPGLSIMMVSQYAMSVFNERKAPIPSYYGSWRKWLPVMKAYEARTPAYFATPAVQLIQALHVSLKQILTQTPDIMDRFAKHEAVSDHVKRVVASWGLRMVPAIEEAAHTMTGVYLPEGMALPQLLPKVSAKGVVLAGGLHPDIAPKYFRIGHMGLSVMEDHRGHIDNVLKVVKEALGEAGYTFPQDAL